MSLQTELIEKIKLLSEDKQVLVKSLLDELAREPERAERRVGDSWYGTLEGLGITLSDEDVSEARREMWGGFPREVGP